MNKLHLKSHYNQKYFTYALPPPQKKEKKKETNNKSSIQTQTRNTPTRQN